MLITNVFRGYEGVEESSRKVDAMEVDLAHPADNTQVQPAKDFKCDALPINYFFYCVDRRP